MNHRFPRELDELPRIFRFLDDAAHTLHLDADAKFALDLAVEELFTNALKHNPSGGGPLEIEVWIEGDPQTTAKSGTDPVLRVTFTDPDASPFDPASVPPVDTLAPLHDRKPGGLGLHILSSIMDHVESEHDGRISRIHLGKFLPDHV
ncbi:MAG: ATP-binding protein [Rhodothermales bacterium]